MGRTLGALTPPALLRNCSVAPTPWRSRSAPAGGDRADGSTRRLAHDVPEHPAEGAEAGEADVHADVGDAAVGGAQPEHARSTRRRCRWRLGVSPKVARNVRMKCASDTNAMRASIAMSSGSAIGGPWRRAPAAAAIGLLGRAAHRGITPRPAGRQTSTPRSASQANGSTAVPFSPPLRISKWRCGPVDCPRLPTSATVSPAST